MTRKQILRGVVLLAVFGAVSYFLRWTLGPASGQFLCGRSYASQECLQRFTILNSRYCNAVAHLSHLFAGGVCNGTNAAGNQQPRRAGFRDLGAGVADRFGRSLDRHTRAHSGCASGTVLGPKTSIVSSARRTRQINRGMGLHCGVCAGNAMAGCPAEADLL